MNFIYKQFSRPTGSLGWIAGRAMKFKNAARSRWALQLLNAQKGENVLEVGFGSGSDIIRLADSVGPTGIIYGIDASDVMVRMASRRNRVAILEERVFLEHAVIPELPFGDELFDAVYSVNCVQFWPDLDAGLVAIRRALVVGGRAVVAVQPRHRGARPSDSEHWGEKLKVASERAALEVVRRELSPDAIPTAAVVLQRGRD